MVKLLFFEGPTVVCFVLRSQQDWNRLHYNTFLGAGFPQFTVPLKGKLTVTREFRVEKNNELTA